MVNSSSLGSQPWSVAVDPWANRAYVTNVSSDDLTLIVEEPLVSRRLWLPIMRAELTLEEKSSVDEPQGLFVSPYCKLNEEENHASSGRIPEDRDSRLLHHPVRQPSWHAWAETTVWTSYGPEGGEISAMAFDPTNPLIVYAGTPHGRVFKSTNGGASWNAADAGLQVGGVGGLAVDPVAPSTLYVVGNRVFKSTNGGVSWTLTRTETESASFPTAMAVDPSNHTTIYAGRFRSMDAGASWSLMEIPPGCGEPVHALAFSPGNPATIYARTSGCLLESTDSGRSWSIIPGGGGPALAIDPNSPATIYAGGGDGVFKTTDGGATWNAMNNGLSATMVTTLAIDPATPATIYAGTDGGGAFKSMDGGQNWTDQHRLGGHDGERHTG